MDDQAAVELLRAIRKHSGMELSSIRDAGNYGADTGFAGFSYTEDGAAFYRANSDTIDAVLQEDAEEFGYPNVGAFIASFIRSDMTNTRDGRDCLIAWYVLESVGRWLNERLHDRGRM